MNEEKEIIVTSGSHYLDIDAYACCVALKELLELKGEKVACYAFGDCNYSVCPSLMKEGQMADSLPNGCSEETAKYIIVDVSDPHYLKKSVPLENIIGVYDHHAGYEEFWKSRLGDNSHIEFIGAAATLIYREWKKAGLEEKITRSTAKLLIAAILDNTLNLTSSNTTEEDREAFDELCKMAGVGEEWCGDYFSEVQKSVEKDLKNALFNDIKNIGKMESLPSHIAQLCVWDAKSIFEKLPEIRQWLDESLDEWMINIIDIKHCCSYFVCDNDYYKKETERIFGVRFENCIAKSEKPYLRKQILKNVLDSI